MTQEWITDRLPTEADGDQDGEVRMVLRPNGSGGGYFAHWSCVGAGAFWQHTSCWEPPAQPTPTEPDRIAALEQRVAELEAFKKALTQPSPMRYSLGDQP